MCWNSLHFCTTSSPARSCPLIMIMKNSTDYRGQKDHDECLHTHSLTSLSVPFFHQVSDNFDVPFRFKGHGKLSAISSSLCSLPSSHIFLCLFCPSLSTIASVYSTWTLEPVYVCVHVCTLVSCSLLCLNCFLIIYLPLILYIACSGFWLPSNRFNVLSDEMQ